MTTRRPRNYWDDFSNVARELAPICLELGRLPSNKELVNRGLGSLSRNGIPPHGGFEGVAKKLGVKTYDESIGRHGANYWTLETTVNELYNFIKDSGNSNIPTKMNLVTAGRHDLLAAISKLGRKNVLEHPLICTLSLSKNSKIKKWGKEKIVDKLSDLIAELGHFPSGRELDNLGLSGLRGAIANSGGADYYWNLLGNLKYESRVYQKKYFHNNGEKIIEEYLSVTALLGHPATQSELAHLEKSWLARAISKKFGGIPQLCISLGLPIDQAGLLQTNDGHLVRSAYEAILDNIFHLLNISHDSEGIIPGQKSTKYRYDFKLSDALGNDVFVELWGYQELNSNGVSNDYIQTYLRKIITKKALYSSLNLPLMEVNGDLFRSDIKTIFIKILNLLKNHNVIVNDVPLTDDQFLLALIYKPYKVEELLTTLKDIGDSIGHFPSISDLKKMGRTSLVDRIQKVGGFSLVKSLIDLPSKPKKPKKWGMSELKTELNKLIDENGLIPSYAELKKMGRLDIFGAINKHGGFRKVAIDFGFKTLIPSNHSDFVKIEQINHALQPMLTETNKIPTLLFIKKNGPSGLYAAIQKFGGIESVAISLGLELTYPNYNNVDYLFFVIQRLVKKHGYLPTRKQFKELGYDSARQAIDRTHGGLVKFSKLIGTTYQPERITKKVLL